MNKQPDRKTILIVDDIAENIAVLKGALQSDYRIKAALSGTKALSIARSTPKPDLVLLDVEMPDVSGYEICRQLKADNATADIPIIFVTAHNQEADEQTGFNMGAVDYIAKPVSPPLVRARVSIHLQLKSANDQLKDKAETLEQMVAHRTRQLSDVQDATIVAMGSLAETRDNETGNHIRRTQRYVEVLANHLKDHPRFKDFLTQENVILLYKSAPLHDIGKVGIPDRILLKPGKLTDEEFDEMKNHTTYGCDAIDVAQASLEKDDAFLTLAREIAIYHHEKWDGSGYPKGLSGEDIPISARLMAVADVFDALISRRVYKPAFSQEKSVAIIKEGRGTHFDPDVTDAFLNNIDEFRSIAEKFSDSEEDVQVKATR